MKKIKVLMGIALVLLFVVVCAVVFVVMRIDSLAKTAVERGSTYALGVESTVGGVSVSLMSGKIEMTDYRVGNPEGFSSEYLLSNEDLKMEVVTGSLFGDVVDVPTIELTGLTVNIDQEGGATNIEKITEHLKSLGGDDEVQEEEASGGVKVRVGRIVIRDLVANIQALPIGGSMTKFRVPIEELVFEDVTQDNAQGVVVSELLEELFPAILAAIVNKAGELGDVPLALLTDLSGDVVEMAERLSDDAVKIIEGVGGEQIKQVLEGLGGDVGNTVRDVLGGEGRGDAGKAVEEGLNKATDGLRNLLNR